MVLEYVLEYSGSTSTRVRTRVRQHPLIEQRVPSRQQALDFYETHQYCNNTVVLFGLGRERGVDIV